MNIPVITIDGPSGSGKGTISRKLADHLGWHFLDSGALYRLTAMAAMQQSVAPEEAEAVAQVAANLNVVFDTKDEANILLAGVQVGDQIRTEKVGNLASVVAQYPEVRQALLGRQRDFQKAPGLVADGRDMGTIVFPQADLKIFLDASAEERAKRRYKQLSDKGMDVTLGGLLVEITERDERDRQRAVAPLVPADDAVTIDTSNLGIEASFQAVLAQATSRGLAQ